jgi:hypothetical protein
MSISPEASIDEPDASATGHAAIITRTAAGGPPSAARSRLLLARPAENHGGRIPIAFFRLS